MLLAVFAAANAVGWHGLDRAGSAPDLKIKIQLAKMDINKLNELQIKLTWHGVWARKGRLRRLGRAGKTSVTQLVPGSVIRCSY